VFMLLLGGMDRPKINNLFPVRVIESLVGQRQGAENHKQNSGQAEGFHADCAGG